MEKPRGLSVNHLSDARPIRVLFSAGGGASHCYPLLPFARGLKANGHKVSFGVTPRRMPLIAEFGFECFSAGSDARVRNPMADATHRKAPLFQSDKTTNYQERLQHLLDIIKREEIDLVVREQMDFVSCIAAERADIPHAAVQVTGLGHPPISQVFVERLNGLRRLVELPPDPDGKSLQRYLYLSFFPSWIRVSGSALPQTLHVIRPEPYDNRTSGDWPSVQRTESQLPLVYVTLGTLFSRMDAFASIIEALRDEPCRLFITIGPKEDPVALGPQPSHITVARYVPQDVVYPFCSAAVTNGGSGSMIGALAHGVPMVLMPTGADQFHNAQRMREAGVAVVLDKESASPFALRDALREVLANSAFRTKAEQIRAEMSTYPEVTHGVQLLESLARKKEPIFRSPEPAADLRP